MVESSAHPRYTVLMVAPCPFPTSQGSQTLIRQLAAGLAVRGHTVHLATYAQSEYPARLPFSVHRTAKVPGGGRLRAGPSIAKLGLDLLLWRRALAIGHRERPDVVHGHNYEGALIGSLVARRLHLPLVYHTHNVMHEELPTYYRNVLIRLLAARAGMVLDRRIPARADAVIALNDTLRDELRSLGVDPGAITVIPPGVWPDEWRGATGAPKNSSIVYTGNLDNYQNISVLLESMALVVARMPEATLTIVSHHRSRELEARARDLGLAGSVDFVLAHGFHAVQRWILRSAVAVCARLPSCGYPIKLVNYLAAGCPVVVSKACANGIVHGETGLVVERNDPESFADAILLLLSDSALASRIGAAGRAFALETLSWQRALDSVEGIYGNLVRNPAGCIRAPGG